MGLGGGVRRGVGLNNSSTTKLYYPAMRLIIPREGCLKHAIKWADHTAELSSREKAEGEVEPSPTKPTVRRWCETRRLVASNPKFTTTRLGCGGVSRS